MSKTSRAVTWGVVLLGTAVAVSLLSIGKAKPKGQLKSQNIIQTNNVITPIQTNNSISTNSSLPTREKRDIFAKDHPLYQTNYSRLVSDSNTVNAVQSFLSNMSHLGPKGRLPPWLSDSLDLEKLRAVKYTDFDNTNYGNFMRASSSSISNMRVDNRDGQSVLKVFEVRKSEDGLPINVASIENSEYRSSRQKVDSYNDPFEKVAKEILTSQGYNLESLASWRRDDWCNNVLVNNYLVATRSYGGKSHAPDSMPDLTVTLVTPASDLNSGAVYTNSFCTSYFVVSDFDKNGNLKAPEKVQQTTTGGTIVYRAPTNQRGKMSTNYPLPGGRK